MQTSASAQLLPPTVQSGEQLGAVSIRISKQGPYPASVTMPPRPFLLFISNRSGTLVDTYSLVLKPLQTVTSALTSLLDLHSGLSSQRDHQLIQLLPGDYEIRFLSHPEWRVSITVSPN